MSLSENTQTVLVLDTFRPVRSTRVPQRSKLLADFMQDLL